MNNKGIFTFIIVLLIVLILSVSYVAYIAVMITGEIVAYARLAQERLERIEYAIDASASGVHDRLDAIEAKVYSYEDAMEAISLVLERNTGYMLYQELGVVVMSHDEYLRRRGD